jgi:hypothetical protein
MNPMMLVPLAMWVSVAEAGQNGQIRGKVVDDKGNPVAGVEVVASGRALAGEVTVTTAADGTYRFSSLPPGFHDLLIVGPDTFAPVRVEAEVRVDETTYVPVTLRAAVVGETSIVVEEVRSVVDTTKSSFSAKLDDKLLQNLPVGRSFQDAVNMVAGVSGRIDTDSGGNGNGNPSVRGEGQYGNNFLVDGLSTRDPSTKTFGTDVNFDAIQDIKVYTDGAPAEFGQFAGMVVNVVVKDGGDEHHGTAGYWLSTDATANCRDLTNVDDPKGACRYTLVDFENNINAPQLKSDFVSHSFSGTAGGPIIKEKLWYFAALQAGGGNQITAGMDPRAPSTGINGTFLGKVTWFATPDLKLQYMYNGSAGSSFNQQTSQLYTPDSQSRGNQTDATHLLTATWNPTSLSELMFKVGSTNSSLDSVPMSGDEDTPAVLNRDTGVLSDNWTDFDVNKRSRLGGTVTFTQTVPKFLGSHRVKVGGEFWRLRDQREVRFTGQDQGRKYQSNADFPCTAHYSTPGDYSDCYRYFEYRDGGPLGHQALNTSLFVQDDWSFSNFTVNLGVRADNERLFQNAGKQIKVGDRPELHLDPTDPAYIAPYSDADDRPVYNPWMIQPRFGAAWNVTGDNKTNVAVNAGRYYDINGLSLADWGDTRSVSYFNLLQNDGAGNFNSIYIQDPSGNPIIYGADLVTAHMDKLTLSVEREVIPLLSVGLRGILSQTSNLPEDFDIDGNTFQLLNPGASKKRDYRAVELTVNKRFDERWQLMASYTLSESKGHAPGQFERSTGGDFGSDGNNVGVYLDDINTYESPTRDPATGQCTALDGRDCYFDLGYGWVPAGFAGLGTSTDEAGWYGYLPYHSFHSVKINGSYSTPQGTTLGLVYEFDSGHAWQKRTYVDLYGDYSGISEGRGGRFMPPVNYVDVRIAQMLQLRNDRSLEFTLDVFNLLDLKSPIAYYENDNQSFGLVTARQDARSIRAGVRLTY